PACSCASAATSFCPKECWSTSSDHQPFESLARTAEGTREASTSTAGCSLAQPGSGVSPGSSDWPAKSTPRAVTDLLAGGGQTPGGGQTLPIPPGPGGASQRAR